MDRFYQEAVQIMNRVAWLLMIAALTCAVSVSACAPNVLASNAFFDGFVNHEYLNILAVIMTITIAGSAQIHLELNKIEEQRGAELFRDVRLDVGQSCLFLIVGFIAGIIIVALKAIMEDPRLESFMVGLALVVLLGYVLVLHDIVGSIFEIKPLLAGKSSRNPPFCGGINQPEAADQDVPPSHKSA